MTSESRKRRLGRVAVVGFATLVLALPGLSLVPGVVWPGTAVVEPCDDKAREAFGEGVYAVRGAEHVRWWTPAWSCPLSNGETVTVRAW